MKANELMTGDWVQVKDCIDQSYYFDEYEPGEIVQVREILDNGINPNWAGAEVSSILGLEDIQPIPITPEILEKNGMKEFKHRNPWQGENLIKKWYHKSGDYYVSLYQVGCEQSYTFGDGYRPTRICNIHYIHELQHALRLCGIDKTIEL